jgi:ribosomal protein S3AE
MKRSLDNGQCAYSDALILRKFKNEVVKKLSVHLWSKVSFSPSGDYFTRVLEITIESSRNHQFKKNVQIVFVITEYIQKKVHKCHFKQHLENY